MENVNGQRSERNRKNFAGEGRPANLERRRSRVSRISHLGSVEGPLKQTKTSKMRKFYKETGNRERAIPHPMLSFRERQKQTQKLHRQRGTKPSIPEIASRNDLNFITMARIVRDMQKRYDRKIRWSRESVELLQEQVERPETSI